jgi:uncharacterized RDD family membrane protein YckC
MSYAFNHTIDHDEGAALSGVRTRRVFAFLIDYAVVLLLCIPVSFVIALLGIATLGAGWLLYSIMFPAIAIIYVGSTLGSPAQATPGMQMQGIRLVRTDGKQIDGLLGVVHAVLFWSANVLMTPLILLVSLFTERKQTLHDLLLGTVVVRTGR